MDGIDLSEEELALLLSNAFFNTGVVQSSEAMAHATLALAQNADVAKALAAETVSIEYCKGFVNECLRLWPLFGIAHRILTDDVKLPAGSGLKAESVVPRGTVVCFNYPAYHSQGYDNPHKLTPERWLTLRQAKANFCPFGMASNRPCPAQHLSTQYLQFLLPYFAARLEFASPVEHSRSLPGRGLAAVSPKGEYNRLRGAFRCSLMVGLWTLDEAENATRSVRQFACSFGIVSDAKRLRLCQRYFESGQRPLPMNQQFAEHTSRAK